VVAYRPLKANVGRFTYEDRQLGLHTRLNCVAFSELSLRARDMTDGSGVSADTEAFGFQFSARAQQLRPANEPRGDGIFCPKFRSPRVV
jgi:hypothetical protein